MGAIFPIGDSKALANGIINALEHPEELQQANTDFQCICLIQSRRAMNSYSKKSRQR